MTTPQANRRAKILVTGASGFIGRAVCARLMSDGHYIRALTRSDASTIQAAETMHFSGFDDWSGIRAGMTGQVDTVIHLAGRAHVMNEGGADPLPAFRRANVEGTRNLIVEAANAGVRTFILASSVKAVGEANSAPWTEETEPQPTTPYGISKLEAEHVAASIGASFGMRVISLRLPLVYGPRMRANMLRLFRNVSRGLPLPLAGIDNRRSLCYVENVAAAAAGVIGRGHAAGVYFVSDGEDVSTPELVRRVAIALDRPCRLVAVPVGLIRWAARAGDQIGKVIPAPMTSAVANRLLGSLAVSSARLVGTLGGPLPYTLDQGLRRTAEWFRQGAHR